MSGTSPADPAAAAELLGSLEEAGATWWEECNYEALESAEPMLRRFQGLHRKTSRVGRRYSSTLEQNTLCLIQRAFGQLFPASHS
jgi:hypothetical protein